MYADTWCKYGVRSQGAMPDAGLGGTAGGLHRVPRWCAVMGCKLDHFYATSQARQRGLANTGQPRPYPLISTPPFPTFNFTHYFRGGGGCAYIAAYLSIIISEGWQNGLPLTPYASQDLSEGAGSMVRSEWEKILARRPVRQRRLSWCIRYEQGQEIKGYGCIVCGDIFSTHNSIKSHMFRKHPGEMERLSKDHQRTRKK